MLLDSGKGPQKPAGPVDKLMQKPAPAAKPAPLSVDQWERGNPRSWSEHLSALPTPLQPGPTPPRTANEILGIKPFEAKPDPLSYANREEITASGYASGKAAGTLHPEQQKAFEAKEAEASRAEREKMLGISTGALTTTPDLLKEQLKQLTPDEYAKLSGRQRAAVDYNTLLSTAVKKDLSRQDRYKGVSADQKATYDESVKNMFGDDHGSDLYAPETMAVLRQLKISDPTDDLDDYLGMKVAITADDLTNITEKQPAPNYVIEGRAPQEDRGKLSIVEGLVDKTQQMESSLARGKQMLQSFTATAAAERADDLGRLGGSSPLASRPDLGFSPTQLTQTGAPADLNSYFRQAFEALADEKHASDRPQVLEALQADLHPDELAAFKSYADTRLRNSRTYGASMGENPEAQYTSPKEFRRLLGLDR